MTKEEKGQMLIVDDYISTLLAKPSIFDRDWVEVDDLDSPLRETVALGRESSKVPFEIMRMVNDDIQLGAVYITPASQFLLKDSSTGRRYWLKTVRIRQLLYDNVIYTRTIETVNGSRLVVYLDKQLLLDNAEPDKCS